MPVFHKHCPLCNSEFTADIYPSVNGFTITRCRSCSLVFVKEKLSTSELVEYYNQAEGEDMVYADPENVENLNYYFHKLRELIHRRIPSGRILDVGCSAGYFLDVMNGWERHGIEISSHLAAKARQKYGDRIHTGALEDSTYPAEYFDVITFQDVFDHLPNPLEILAFCRRMLKPFGLIMIKVHNIECIYARLAGRRFYAIIPPAHLFYYSDKTLRFALKEAGFSHVTSTFIGHTIFIKTIPYRLAQTRRTGLTYKLYRILGRMPVGNLRIRKNLHDIITVVGVKQ